MYQFKKYWLIISLFLIAVLLLFLKLKYSCKGDDCSKKINVTEVIENSKKDLRNVLPYEGKCFKTERYMNSEYLEIIVKSGFSLEETKKEVESWLETNKTNSQEVQLIYVFEQDEMTE